ncbi:MAG: DNA-binding GntR family transcriptional regulator [Arcobacteraceae bacterium]|jgi:DNA-binding GntR family transcriptional regulator
MKYKVVKDKHKTITEQVYEKLEDLIVFCKIEPGSILTEAEIAEMVGAGRTPVREALRLLANESLVSISRIGILIPEMSGMRQLQLMEIRRALLKFCVDKAIQRLTEVDKKNLQHLVDIVDDQDDIEFMNWLKQRHKVLAKSSKNQFIYEELRNVQGLTHRFWYFYAKKDNHSEAKQLHKNILQAVINEDIVAANHSVDTLMDYLEDFVRNNAV